MATLFVLWEYVATVLVVFLFLDSCHIVCLFFFFIFYFVGDHSHCHWKRTIRRRQAGPGSFFFHLTFKKGPTKIKNLNANFEMMT
jgi:hypothetical protein